MTTDDLPARYDRTEFDDLPARGIRHAAPRYAPTQPDWLGEWGRYLRSVRRHKWLVLGLTLAGTLAGLALSVFMLHPTYVARATVWIQVPTARLGRDPGPFWQGQLPISSGWLDLLRTNIVREDEGRTERLYLEPKVPGDSDVLATFGLKERTRPGVYRLVGADSGKSFTRFGKGQGVVGHGVPGDSVGAALGFAWVPPAAALWPGRSVVFTVTGPADAARQLGGDLKISADVDANFVRLELHGSDPAHVTATVNAVAQRFVAAAATLKRDNLVQLAGILGAQLDHAQANLRAAETALKSVRVRVVTQYVDSAEAVTPNLLYPRDPMFAGLLDMKVNREVLQRDGDAIGRILAAPPDSGLAIDALGMIGSVEKSTELSQALRDLTAKQAELRALRVHYTDASPAVRRVAAEVDALQRRAIPTMAAALRRGMATRAGELGQ